MQQRLNQLIEQDSDRRGRAAYGTPPPQAGSPQQPPPGYPQQPPYPPTQQYPPQA
jgi:hypothetical protein